MVAICIKYCYVLLINLYYIPDPPLFIACNLRNSLNTPAHERRICKIHLASNVCIIQGFVNDGLYRMIKFMYFYRIHTYC